MTLLIPLPVADTVPWVGMRGSSCVRECFWRTHRFEVVQGAWKSRPLLILHRRQGSTTERVLPTSRRTGALLMRGGNENPLYTAPPTLEAKNSSHCLCNCCITCLISGAKASPPLKSPLRLECSECLLQDSFCLWSVRAKREYPADNKKPHGSFV